MSKNSDALVDGVSYRDFVLGYYHKGKLTKGLFEEFRKDLEGGNIELPQ